MSMEMKHGLPRSCVGIQNGTIPGVRNSFRARDLRRHEQYSPKCRGIFRVRQRINMLARDNENVHRGLWVDISKCDTVLVFSDNLCRDFFPNDFAE